uniref:Uncharacterized protein n=1 Tax=Anguilla anguilla TaxID=7936 RepID=A0A0E9PT43_ANGAN
MHTNSRRGFVSTWMKPNSSHGLHNHQICALLELYGTFLECVKIPTSCIPHRTGGFPF